MKVYNYSIPSDLISLTCSCSKITMYYEKIVEY